MTTVLVYESSDSIMGIAQSEYVSSSVIRQAIDSINDLWVMLNDHNCADTDLLSFIEMSLPSKIRFIKREDIEEMWRD